LDSHIDDHLDDSFDSNGSPHVVTLSATTISAASSAATSYAVGASAAVLGSLATSIATADTQKETLSAFLEFSALLVDHSAELVHIWASILSVLGNVTDFRLAAHRLEAMTVIAECFSLMSSRYLRPTVRTSLASPYTMVALLIADFQPFPVLPVGVTESDLNPPLS
jgi:hypothetical protein